MKSERYICDNCLKETVEWCEESSWFKILLQGYSGLKEFKKLGIKTNDKKRMYEELDFCSTACITEYFENFVATEEDK